jgi:hypothetical protein
VFRISGATPGNRHPEKAPELSIFGFDGASYARTISAIFIGRLALSHSAPPKKSGPIITSKLVHPFDFRPESLQNL